MVIPQVYVSVVGLIESVPQFLKTAQQWIVKFLKDNTEIQETFLSSYNTAALSFEEWLNREIIPNLESLSSTLEWARETLLPNITGVITNVTILVKDVIFWLKDLLIAVIVSIYLLARKDVFAAQCKKMVYSMLPPRYGDLMVEETRNAYRIMSGFINGKLLDSLSIGLLTFICCTVFFLPVSGADCDHYRRYQYYPVFRPVHRCNSLSGADFSGGSDEVSVFCHFCVHSPAV